MIAKVNNLILKPLVRKMSGMKLTPPLVHRNGSFRDSNHSISPFTDDSEVFLLNEMFNNTKPMNSNMYLKDSMLNLCNSGFVQEVLTANDESFELTEKGSMFCPIDPEKYFEKNADPDLRNVNVNFNQSVIDLLGKVGSVFDKKELKYLNDLNVKFQENKSRLSPEALKREQQIVSIDYVWKSGAFEGNSYSIMETEILLYDRVTPDNKSLDDLLMIVDHKKALDFVMDSEASFKNLSIDFVAQVHNILCYYLPITHGIRQTPVRISGTRYLPLKDRVSIENVLPSVLAAINSQTDPYSASLVATVLFSYLQAFEDGNKRTARLLGNGMMLAHGLFPVTYRTIDYKHYIKALLLFYETGNLNAFKEIFLQQAEYSAQKYFNVEGIM